MSQSDVARHEGCRRQHKARMSQGNVAKHEGAEDNTACVSQSDVAGHEGSEVNTKFACRKAMWLGTRGAEGNTKLACRKAMWLSTRVPQAIQSLHVARQCGRARWCRRQHKARMLQGIVARQVGLKACFTPVDGWVPNNGGVLKALLAPIDG
ncbi:unnamed protein product [Prunus armeniaca]